MNIITEEKAVLAKRKAKCVGIDVQHQGGFHFSLSAVNRLLFIVPDVR
jgi:hypothetical protein